MTLETRVAEAIDRMRLAQQAWSQRSVSQRSKHFRRIASKIVEQREVLANGVTAPMRTSYLETITAELLPLAETAKWLSRSMARVLRTRYTSPWDTPMWLGSLRSEVQRSPLGVVLIIGTWNYPIFLTGSQMLHALAAGNGVIIKPAPGCEAVTQELANIAVACGIPSELITVLDSSVLSAQQAIECGVDHIVMTGSSSSGRKVLQQAAGKLTPATMELSGCDAVMVLPDANLDRVVNLLRFGLMLNGGATCIAPRRVFVPEALLNAFEEKLRQQLHSAPCVQWTTLCAETTKSNLNRCVEQAIELGAKPLLGDPIRNLSNSELSNSELSNSDPGRTHAQANPPTGLERIAPVVLTGVKTTMDIFRLDVFAPLMMIVPVESIGQAVQWNRECPYGLCVALFGSESRARELVPELNAGTILINDFIVPTADPRLPFGGRGESGYGVTRGEEGLLAMSVPKVVAARRGKWLPHSNLPHANDEQLLDGLLQLQHGEQMRDRLKGLRQVIRSIFYRTKKK